MSLTNDSYRYLLNHLTRITSAKRCKRADLSGFWLSLCAKTAETNLYSAQFNFSLSPIVYCFKFLDKPHYGIKYLTRYNLVAFICIGFCLWLNKDLVSLLLDSNFFNHFLFTEIFYYSITPLYLFLSLFLSLFLFLYLASFKVELLSF